ncbi:MAG TPA: ComEC/Rec2 family competence protein, partial [Micromonosporaceae bacterium]
MRNLRFGLAYAIVAILLGLVCGALATAARTFARDSEPLASLSRQHVVALAELTVTDDPRRLRSTRPGPPTYLVPARLTALRSDHIGRLSLDVRVVVFGSGDAWRSLLPSQRVAASTRLDRADGGDLTAAVLSATGDPQPLTAPSWLQRAAGRLRAGLQAACRSLPPQPGGLLPGLVIGDVSRLDPALVEEFRETGLTHLTAVSGANLAIMLGVVLFLARWCRAGPVTAMLVCAAAVVGFVVLARPSPSVIRAAAMGSVGLLALASGRAHAAPPSLAVAVTAGLLIDPGLAVDAGFALSALATGALVLVAPRWRDALRRRGVPPMIAEALAVPAAAQVLCAPIIAAISGSVSVAAILANLLAAPAVAPATLLGIGAALLSALWLDGAAMLAWLASWPARWLVEIAHVGAALPVGSFPWPTGLLGGLSLAGLTAAAFIVGRRPAARRALVVVALGIAVGTVPIRLISPGWPPDGSVVVACDVGQGDAVVLPVAPGRAVVIDAGPDPAAVDGCLNRLGVRTVDALLLTHFHVDHIGGLAGVLRGRQVRSLVL